MSDGDDAVALAGPGEPGTDTTETDGILLRVRNLHTHFGASGGFLGRGSGVVKAVNDVSFDLREGDIFGLVGESGSGKTTLGRTVLGLAPATSGEVWWRGRDLAQLSERKMRPLRRQMGMVFQDPNASLNPAMTIVQGVGHPLRIHGIETSRRAIRQRVAEMLERCGLTPAQRYLDTYPEDVSGGQKQRVVIARTLITEPELVVADEPVAALDMSVRAKVLELMLDLKEQLGLTYIYITHDLTSGRFVCDQIGIMYLGELVEWGDASRVYDHPQHPYTDALLGAVPLPDPSRKGRDKNLPAGEIPDALDPPAGCQFHPRCPRAFGPCGWEGSDLVDYLERRWTEVDAATFEEELDATGPIDSIKVDGRTARFPAGSPDRLLPLLQDLHEREVAPIFSGVSDISSAGGDVVVTFAEGPAPTLLPVAGRMVACHLHER
ncbi:ABC transporter ATP-binding protein [Euzebya tangerina]|uniref:ABC transporter ATP-binding protein n=1 Tax=Euzebya tangerina TaxID=591198 RepID=UPI000E314428|nr:ABC transporter ATP-binding protein [Euzebya tangerina]